VPHCHTPLTACDLPYPTVTQREDLNLRSDNKVQDDKVQNDYHKWKCTEQLSQMEMQVEMQVDDYQLRADADDDNVQDDCRKWKCTRIMRLTEINLSQRHEG